MDEIFLNPPAKINIALDILNKRPDGYHNMKMVMQTIALCDRLAIKKTEHTSIVLHTNRRDLPGDERNLVYQAASYMKKEFALKEGLEIYLEKRIPMASGLAGGSSDCAATLIGIRDLFHLPLSHRELMHIGNIFGADVPFCVLQGTALAEGTGDILTPLPDHPPTSIVLVKPPFSVSTAEVFKQYDNNKVTNRPDLEQILTYLKNGDIRNMAGGMVNVLETVTLPLHLVLTEIKESLVEFGALNALMSGSGPTIFAYFSSSDIAHRAVLSLKAKYGPTYDIVLTNTFNPLPSTP